MGVTNLARLFVEGAVEGFVDFVVPVTAFSTAINVVGADIGDTVRVPFVNNASASSAFSYATGYVANGNGVTGKDITLNTLLYQEFNLTDTEMSELSTDALIRLGRQAGARLGVDVMSASLAAVISDANFPTSASYSSVAFSGSAALADLDKLANDKKWPSQDRSIIAGTSLWQQLMSNPGITAAYAYGGSEAVRLGQIPSIFGFKPYKTTSTLPNGDKGIAMAPQGILLGMAWHKAPSEANTVLIDSFQATDTRTGLVLGYRSWYDPKFATTMKVIDCLIGVALGDPNGLIQIK